MRIVFAGTPTFAQPCLHALLQTEHEVVGVFTQPDRAAGRGRKLRESCIKTFAKTQQLPVFQPSRLDEAASTTLASLAPDLMVVVAYGLLLPATVLTLPRYGCINVHASLLPRWRGAAPIARAILAGDSETGVSIMRMQQGLDTGPVYLQRSYTLQPQETSQSLHDKLATLGAQALLDTLAQLTKLTPVPQNDALANYANKLSKQEAACDWSHTAEQLARQVRGYDPWPLAFTHAQEHLIRIWQARALTQTSHSKTPTGYIHTLDEHGISVQTGQGLLQIQRLQFAGGKPISVQDLLNAPKPWLQVGTVLGSLHAKT